MLQSPHHTYTCGMTGQDEARDQKANVGRRDLMILTPNLIEIVAALRLFTAVA